MDKETSSRVSSVAGRILNMEPATSTFPLQTDYNSLLHDAKILAGSAMSQDETPGQHGIHPAPEEFSTAQITTDPILHFFHYAHLPPKLQATSRQFFNLAQLIVLQVPRNAERTVALRKLLEAKDAVVRANLPSPVLAEKSTVASGSEPELGEPKETGGHSEDRDGPIPFSG